MSSDKEPTIVGQTPEEKEIPFGGGSGGGVSVQPVGFLVVSGNDDIRFQVVDDSAILDRLLDQIPDLIGQVKEKLSHKKSCDMTAEKSPATVVVE